MVHQNAVVEKTKFFIQFIVDHEVYKFEIITFNRSVDGGHKFRPCVSIDVLIGFFPANEFSFEFEKLNRYLHVLVFQKEERKIRRERDIDWFINFAPKIKIGFVCWGVIWSIEQIFLVTRHNWLYLWNSNALLVNNSSESHDVGGAFVCPKFIVTNYFMKSLLNKIPVFGLHEQFGFKGVIIQYFISFLIEHVKVTNVLIVLQVQIGDPRLIIWSQRYIQ